MNSPAVNTELTAPEWSVVGVPCEGADQHADRIHVYQNGALVVDAVADEPTHAALCELARKANEHSKLISVKDAANRVAELYRSGYIRGHSDGGRASHAIGQLDGSIQSLRPLR